MRTQAFNIKIMVILVAVAFCWLNVGSVRCESPPKPKSSAQLQAKRDQQRSAKAADEQDLREERSDRFKEMEWLIMQHLLKQYQELEVRGDLEDSLD